MKLFFNFVVCVLCFNIAVSGQTYKAGIINAENKNIQVDQYAAFISEASKLDVDVLVLPSPEITETDLSSLQKACGVHNYDEAVRIISNAAKQGRLYVVAHLFEKIRCQNNNELIRSNLVFDRKGAIISVFRKRMNTKSNCNSTATEFNAFTTDFGVTFGVLMEEDLALQNLESLKGVRNFVVSGKWTSEIPFLTVAQLSAPWAYVNEANLISSVGIFAGKSGAVGSSSRIITAELNSEGSGHLKPFVNPPTKHLNSEDLSQYSVRPLDLEASEREYKEYVCHRKFCCEFYVKASSEELKKSNRKYYLAVYNGVRHFSGARLIGVEACVLFSCVRVDESTCIFGSENNIDAVYHEISVSGNFTSENSAQYPMIVSNGVTPTNQFKFEKIGNENTQHVTIRTVNSDIINFGIFGRVYSKDTENYYSKNAENSGGLTNEAYDYLFNEDVREFFDYLWIRLRVLIFIVSIYILEMM